MQLISLFQGIFEEWFTGRGLVKALSWIIFFVPSVAYFLRGSAQPLGLPVTLELGVIAVSVAFGGLALTVGLNLNGPKRKETIRVAQRFIMVVVLMVVFLPTLHFVELMDGISANSFQPDRLDA